MKKHAKAMTGLAVSAIALAAAGFGFSRWSSDLNLNGKVTAAGSWDVSIADARVVNISSAAEAVVPTAEVTVYPVYAGIADYYEGRFYRVKIDDVNPLTMNLSADELAEYTRNMAVPGVNNVYDFYTSCKSNCTIFYNMNLNDLGKELGFMTNTVTNVEIKDDGASEGKLIGYAIGRIKGTGNNRLKIALDYERAVEETAANKVGAPDKIPATAEVTVYDVYADYCTDFKPTWEEYRVHIDDLHPRTVTMTLAELEEYNYRCFVSGDVMVGYNFYESGLRGSNIQYMMKLNQDAYDLGFESGRVYAENPDGSKDGIYLGTAIGEHLAAPRKNPWNIQIQYNETVELLSNTPDKVEYTAAISEDGQSAEFGTVNMSLPGAWAEYAVTIVNNGTANANLADYSFTAEGDESVFGFDVPSLPADEVLKPGESCQITFVVRVDEEYTEKELDAEGTIQVRLQHVQDTVEAPAAPAHNHG